MKSPIKNTQSKQIATNDYRKKKAKKLDLVFWRE